MGTVEDGPRVIVKLPSELLATLAAHAGPGKAMHEVIREGLEFYASYLDQRRQLARGYQEMAWMNRAMAENRWDLVDSQGE
ncbi:MAG: CopG family transcriptional regulator [Firmicutes bacterium]|nr:CopG family transcriptional regulator [Bacillota bacterium]